MIGPWRRARDAERAREVAETDRDIARAEKASAYEAIGKIAAAAGRLGAPTRWNVEDIIAKIEHYCRLAADRLDHLDKVTREVVGADRALVDAGMPVPDGEDGSASAIRELADQRDTLGAELIAVDEVLAELAAGPADDRVEAIRKLARGTDRDPTRRATGEPADDGVVDAEIACGAAIPWPVAPGFLPHCGRAADHEGRCFPARDAWCSADLDGARCARPAGHDEPCRPADERGAVMPAAELAERIRARLDSWRPFEGM